MLYISNSWIEQWSDNSLTWLERHFDGVRGNWFRGKYQAEFDSVDVTFFLHAPSIARGCFEPTTFQMKRQPSISWILYPDAILDWDTDSFTYGTRVGTYERSVLDCSATVMANTRYTRNLLSRAGIKSRTCMLGVDVTSIQEVGSNLCSRQSSPLRVLWNHQWRWQKNPSGAFSIVAELASRHPQVQFLLGRREQWGTSEVRLADTIRLYKALLNDISTHDLSNVNFIEEFAEQRDYWRFLSTIDVTFSCSHEESFGRAMVEAAAAGSACVVPHAYAYPEVMPHALHVGNSEAGVANGIERLLLDQTLRNSISYWCRRDAEALDLGKTCALIVDMFRILA